MSFVDEFQKLGCLWGTNLYNIEIDYFLNCSKFYIKFFEGDTLKFYELVFKKMLSFHIQNKETYLSHNVELTEIHYSKDKNYKFCLLIWSENYTIDIECEDWSLRLLEEYNENE